MSKTYRDRISRSGCNTPDKRGFRSQHVALSEADRLGMWAYECQCAYWHLTSKKPSGWLGKKWNEVTV